MVQQVFRVLALTAILATTVFAPTAPAAAFAGDICMDLFDTREVRLLPDNEFGVLAHNIGAGRSFLDIRQMTGWPQTDAKNLTLVPFGDRRMDINRLFRGIDPVRARALVFDPNNGIAGPETRIVTMIGMRIENDREQYIARLGDGQLVLVWLHEVIESNRVVAVPR